MTAFLVKEHKQMVDYRRKILDSLARKCKSTEQLMALCEKVKLIFSYEDVQYYTKYYLEKYPPKKVDPGPKLCDIHYNVELISLVTQLGTSITACPHCYRRLQKGRDLCYG